jgi:hypothetical protein
MRMSRLLLLFILAAAHSLFAAACAPALLSVYDAAAFSCDVGPYTVKNFSFSLISSTVTILDSDITVTPVFGPDTFGLNFASNKFNVTGTDSAKYLLAYTWDPGDIRGFLDEMDTDPPVFPGLAQITTDLCEDLAFAGSVCGTTQDTLVVSDNGVIINHTASVNFSPHIGTVGVRNTIELDGNGQSAVFTSFTNTVESPEPSTWTASLLLLAFLLRHLIRFMA